jgi:hypothetical protein
VEEEEHDDGDSMDQHYDRVVVVDDEIGGGGGDVVVVVSRNIPQTAVVAVAVVSRSILEVVVVGHYCSDSVLNVENTHDILHKQSIHPPNRIINSCHEIRTEIMSPKWEEKERK